MTLRSNRLTAFNGKPQATVLIRIPETALLSNTTAVHFEALENHLLAKGTRGNSVAYGLPLNNFAAATVRIATVTYDYAGQN